MNILLKALKLDFSLNPNTEWAFYLIIRIVKEMKYFRENTILKNYVSSLREVCTFSIFFHWEIEEFFLQFEAQCSLRFRGTVSKKFQNNFTITNWMTWTISVRTCVESIWAINGHFRANVIFLLKSRNCITKFAWLKKCILPVLPTCVKM